MNFKGKFIVDKKGHRVGVLFNFRAYSKLVDYVEDIEDSLELKHALANEREKGIRIINN